MRWPDLALSDLSGTTAVVLDVDGTIAGRDHRVSPGNARPEALAVARAVTGHHADEGAADVLEDVLHQLRQRAA